MRLGGPQSRSGWYKNKENKLLDLSPRANYTDRTTAACQRSYCQLLRIEGCCVVSAADPCNCNLGFPDRSRYPVPDPLLLRISGGAGNRIRTSGSVARNSDYYTTEAVFWTIWKCENFLPYHDSNSDSLVIRPVPSCYSHYTNTADAEGNHAIFYCLLLEINKKTKERKLRGLCLWVNYTDLATAACRRS
jgi:hypothetical protein